MQFKNSELQALVSKLLHDQQHAKHEMLKHTDLARDAEIRLYRIRLELEKFEAELKLARY